MKLYSIIFILLLSIQLLAQEDISDLLYDLPDVKFEQVEAISAAYTSYELNVKQPIDHKDKSKGYFYQKVYLNHKSMNQLNVMVTNGYGMAKNTLSEVTSILDANELAVEHRFFGNSIPQNADWKYLNLEQATADLHKIKTLMAQIYKNKWVATGISKGGQTTIAYRYYYPDDVTVSIPYVAPLNNDFEDKRIYKFLKKVGTSECRKNIKQYQKRLLKKKEKIMPLLEWYVKGNQQKFTYHRLEEAFEYGVLEYSFSFWQWGKDCGSIPNKKASEDEMLEHFMDVVSIDFYTDLMVKFYEAHYYQASTQLGYYGFKTWGFRRHLDVLGKRPHASFEPNKMDTEYSHRYNKKVSKWLAKKGDRFLYIYGELDTWSATAVPVSEKVDAEWFMMKGMHHGNARIANFTADEKARFAEKLQEWLGVTVRL